MFRRVIFLTSCVLMVLLAGCMGANEEFIQGRWEYQSDHLANIPAESHLHVTWEFYGGSFYSYACCFNVNQEITGKYRILNDEGNVLDLELFDIQGTGTGGNIQLRIKIDQETDTLTIMGTKPFIRLTPP